LDLISNEEEDVIVSLQAINVRFLSETGATTLPTVSYEREASCHCNAKGRILFMRQKMALNMIRSRRKKVVWGGGMKLHDKELISF
jgi:hypothetical protein